MSLTWGQRIGFDTHLGAPAYFDTAKVKAALDTLGVTLVRDNFAGAAAKLGPKYRVITVLDTLDKVAALARVDQAIAGGTWAIECFNEPVLAQAPAVKALNAAVLDRVAGRVPVLASSLALPDRPTATAIGRDARYDYGSAHPYRADLNETQWGSRVSAMFADQAVMAPNRPVFVTETGFWVATSNPQNFGHHPTTPANAVGQLRSNISRLFGAGAEGVILYELFFEPNVSVEYERRFGWINPDGSLTPWAEELVAWQAQYGSLDSRTPAGGASPEQVAVLTAQLASSQANAGVLTTQRDILASAVRGVQAAVAGL